MKNLFEVLSPRMTRVSYSVAALLVLMLTLFHGLNVMVFKATSNDQCGWLPRETGNPGFEITQVVPGGVTDHAGIRNGDILLKINGNNFKDGQEAMAIINHIKRNDYAEYLIQRGDSTFTTKVKVLKVFDVNYLANFLLGFGFLVVGYVVVMTRPQGVIQRVFGRFGILSMLFLGLSQFDVRDAAPWVFYTYATALVIGWVVALPNIALFFLRFPVKLKAVDWIWLKVVYLSVQCCYRHTVGVEALCSLDRRVAPFLDLRHQLHAGGVLYRWSDCFHLLVLSSGLIARDASSSDLFSTAL